jgi:hypothetical protein
MVLLCMQFEFFQAWSYSVGFICELEFIHLQFFLSVHISIVFPFSVSIIDGKCLL